MDYSESVVSLDMLLRREPANERLYIAAMEACAEEADERIVVATVDDMRTSLNQIQDGPSIVTILIRHGGIDRTILVDGEPYEGSIDDLQRDESIPDEAKVDYRVQTTQAGLDVVRAYRETMTLAHLFETKPEFAVGYRTVLKECMAEEGKTTNELQAALIESGQIRPGLKDAQSLHASYFTSKLEKYGALVWDRKRWRTTDEGAQFFASKE